MEFLAWDHAKFIDSVNDTEKAMRMAAETGIAGLIIHVKNFDFPLKTYCKAAKEKNVKVHAWVSPAFSVENVIKRTIPPERQAAMQKEFNFVLLGPCLNHPSNQEKGLKNISTLINTHAGLIAGLHLDYIRSDNAQLLRKYPCECDACRAYRKRYLGYERLKDADMDNIEIMYKELEFRNRNITNFVRAAKKLADTAGIALSIAARANYLNQTDLEKAPVYGLGPAVFEGQDWVSWADEGLLDFICPMNYHTDTEKFRSVFNDHARLLAGTKARHYAGIGVKSSLGENPPERVKEHIEIVKKSGGTGCVFFAFGYITEAHSRAIKSALK